MKSKNKDLDNYYNLTDKEKREFIITSLGLSVILFKILRWVNKKN